MEARLLTLFHQEERIAQGSNLQEVFNKAFFDPEVYGFAVADDNGAPTTYYFGDVRSVEEMADGFIEGNLLDKAQAQTFIEKSKNYGVSHYVRTRLANHKEVDENTVVYDHRTSKQTWPAPK